MLESLRPSLVVVSVVCWLSAAVCFAVMARVQLAPAIARTIRQVTKAYIGVFVLLQIIVMIAGHRGLFLPGWFYALIFVGILGPWVISLGAISLTHHVRTTQQR